MSSTTRGFARIVAVAGATLLSVSAVIATGAAPSLANAAVKDAPYGVGLYGSQDPTYDGVYRQGLSILALDSTRARVAPEAVRWLLRQQCSNGRWTSYNPDVTKRCAAGDTNATAVAVMALHAVGRDTQARLGLSWLRSQQQVGGGWEYTTGWGPDSNSTGLVLQALIAMGVRPQSVTNSGSGLTFLRSVQLGCAVAATQRGALDYQVQATPTANDYATAQATQALALTALPVRPASSWTPPQRGTCVMGELGLPADTAATGYLARRIRANAGAIPAAFGPGVDYGSTANAVLSLVAAQTARQQAFAALATLEAGVRDFAVDGDRNTVPAAASLVIFTERATRGNPRDVNGMNLVRRIQRSIAR